MPDGVDSLNGPASVRSPLVTDRQESTGTMITETAIRTVNTTNHTFEKNSNLKPTLKFHNKAIESRNIQYAVPTIEEKQQVIRDFFGNHYHSININDAKVKDLTEKFLKQRRSKKNYPPKKIVEELLTVLEKDPNINNSNYFFRRNSLSSEAQRQLMTTLAEIIEESYSLPMELRINFANRLQGLCENNIKNISPFESCMSCLEMPITKKIKNLRRLQETEFSVNQEFPDEGDFKRQVDHVFNHEKIQELTKEKRVVFLLYYYEMKFFSRPVNETSDELINYFSMLIRKKIADYTNSKIFTKETEQYYLNKLQSLYKSYENKKAVKANNAKGSLNSFYIFEKNNIEAEDFIAVVNNYINRKGNISIDTVRCLLKQYKESESKFSSESRVHICRKIFNLIVELPRKDLFLKELKILLQRESQLSDLLEKINFLTIIDKINLKIKRENRLRWLMRTTISAGRAVALMLSLNKNKITIISLSNFLREYNFNDCNLFLEKLEGYKFNFNKTDFPRINNDLEKVKDLINTIIEEDKKDKENKILLKQKEKNFVLEEKENIINFFDGKYTMNKFLNTHVSISNSFEMEDYSFPQSLHNVMNKFIEKLSRMEDKDQCEIGVSLLETLLKKYNQRSKLGLRNDEDNSYHKFLINVADQLFKIITVSPALMAVDKEKFLNTLAKSDIKNMITIPSSVIKDTLFSGKIVPDAVADDDFIKRCREFIPKGGESYLLNAINVFYRNKEPLKIDKAFVNKTRKDYSTFKNYPKKTQISQLEYQYSILVADNYLLEEKPFNKESFIDFLQRPSEPQIFGFERSLEIADCYDKLNNELIDEQTKEKIIKIIEKYYIQDKVRSLRKFMLSSKERHPFLARSYNNQLLKERAVIFLVYFKEHYHSLESGDRKAYLVKLENTFKDFEDSYHKNFYQNELRKIRENIYPSPKMKLKKSFGGLLSLFKIKHKNR